MLRAVIFDFDGLILDTETPEFCAWEEIFRAHAAELPLEEWAVCIGTTNALDPHGMLEERTGRTLDRADLRAQAHRLRNERLDREIPRPGVLARLTEARQLGLAVGLASSSDLRWVESHLRAHGLFDSFDAITTSEEVERVKPDPALYHRALEKFGLHPSEALALEDSLNGLRAARAAGIRCVAVPNPMTRHLPLHEADWVMESLADLSLAEMAAHFA